MAYPGHIPACIPADLKVFDQSDTEDAVPASVPAHVAKVFGEE